MSASNNKASSWKTIQFWEKYLAGQKDFSKMDLSGIILYNSIFYNLRLEEVNLTGANLERITLSGTTLKQARIERANLKNARLSNCSFQQASLHRSSLAGANLERTDLMEVDFSHADLRNANFMHAKIEGADFRNPNLENARFIGAIYTEDTRFDDDFNPEVLGMSCIGDWTILEFAERHRYEKQQLRQHRSFRLSKPIDPLLFPY